MGVVRRPQQTHRFRNHHSNCISNHDAHCATTGLQPGKPSLQRFIYQGARALRHDVPTRSGHISTGKTTLLLHRSRSYSRRTAWGKEMLAPPASSPPLLRWAQGSLSVPCRLDTPAHKLQAKVGSWACDHALPRVPRYRILPPHSGELWCHDASRDSELQLPA
jgi:hypothetical protein